MRKVREAKDRPIRAAVTRLKALLVELGRVCPLRDPMSNIAKDHALTPPQIHAVLWLGNEGPLPSSVLAQRVGCGQPTVTGLVDRLEKLKLVERIRGGTDRRVVRVKLTAAGNKLFTRLDGAFTEHLDAILGAMSTDDREGIVRIMKNLVDRFSGDAAAQKESA